MVGPKARVSALLRGAFAQTGHEPGCRTTPQRGRETARQRVSRLLRGAGEKHVAGLEGEPFPLQMDYFDTFVKFAQIFRYHGAQQYFIIHDQYYRSTR